MGRSRWTCSEAVFVLVTALLTLLAPASDDEGSTAATDGSTLRTSPADHGGSVGSESGGSAVDSVAGEHSGNCPSGFPPSLGGVQAEDPPGLAWERRGLPLFPPPPTPGQPPPGTAGAQLPGSPLQCPAAAVPTETQCPRAIRRGLGASAPAREPSAPPRGSRRARALKARAKPKGTSTPATGKSFFLAGGGTWGGSLQGCRASFAHPSLGERKRL